MSLTYKEEKGVFVTFEDLFGKLGKKLQNKDVEPMVGRALEKYLKLLNSEKRECEENTIRECEFRLEESESWVVGTESFFIRLLNEHFLPKETCAELLDFLVNEFEFPYRRGPDPHLPNYLDYPIIIENVWLWRGTLVAHNRESTKWGKLYLVFDEEFLFEKPRLTQVGKDLQKLLGSDRDLVVSTRTLLID